MSTPGEQAIVAQLIAAMDQRLTPIQDQQAKLLDNMATFNSYMQKQDEVNMGLHSKFDQLQKEMKDAESRSQARFEALESKGSSSGSGGPGLSSTFSAWRPNAPSGQTFHTPPQSPKKQKVFIGHSFGDTRRSGSVPPARVDRPCAIFVGGFGRDVPTHLRKKQYEDQVKPLIPNELLVCCQPKFPHLQKYYTIAVDDHETLHAILDVLKEVNFQWYDPTFKVTQKVFAKSDKNLDQRNLGKFRHHFYEAITKFLSTHPSFPTESPAKLQMVRGTIHVSYNDDSLGLLSFTRELIKDLNGMEAHYTNWEILGANRTQVDELIAGALALANATTV